MSSSQSRSFLERVVLEVRTGGGRNIVELARALKIPVETTRYKVKGMLKRGLTIHASIDYNKFGLSHHYAYLDLSERARTSEKKFFQSLADHAYLTSVARRLPNNEHVCKFAVPASAGSLRRALKGLSEEGLLESFEVDDVSWVKAHMIEPEFFDLKRGTWRIDWNRVRKEPVAKESKEGVAKVVEFDDLDLMIARELEADALARLSDIASSLKTSLNNIFYHYHKHVLEAKMVEEYTIRWNGTTKTPTSFVQFHFSSLNSNEERAAKNALRRLPFIWSDALSLDTGLYVAEAMIPQDSYIDTLNFLSSNLGSAAGKLDTFVLDSKSRQSFPLPTHMFDGKGWKFDSEEAVSQVSKALKK